MRLLTLVFLLVSVPAYAEDPWLCMAEYAAYVEDDGEAAVDGDGGKVEPGDWRFIINDEGLKRFHDDHATLDQCVWTEGRPVSCEGSNGFAGFFYMQPNRLFTWMYPATTANGNNSAYVLKGTCSRL